jgi:sarcosine/dimethylglycine N-methyltransferase
MTEELAMTDGLDGVRDHYRATGLKERLETALAALGPKDQLLTPAQLAPLDQFHTRGLAATAELADLAQITAEMSVLDVGSGVGGPARFLAQAYGCWVTGVDLSEPFVDAANTLTERTGLSGRVSFETASALELPFDAGRFDAVLMQHVAMNISDRARLYREVRRVLKAGGRLAAFDVRSLREARGRFSVMAVPRLDPGIHGHPRGSAHPAPASKQQRPKTLHL